VDLTTGLIFFHPLFVQERAPARCECAFVGPFA
jgi:hypothetical protein